jgi:hypothetical protein
MLNTIDLRTGSTPDLPLIETLMAQAFDPPCG